MNGDYLETRQVNWPRFIQTPTILDTIRVYSCQDFAGLVTTGRFTVTSFYQQNPGIIEYDLDIGSLWPESEYLVTQYIMQAIYIPTHSLFKTGFVFKGLSFILLVI